MAARPRHPAIAAALLLAVVLPASPAAAAPAVGAEQAISAAIYGPVPGPQGPVSMASNGAFYLAAWRDDARGGIWAARLSPEGDLLDPLGIRLSTTSADPAVASNGTGFLVTWAEDQIFAVRLDASANAIDATPFQVTFDSPESPRGHTVASNGQDYLVAWASMLIDGTGSFQYSVVRARAVRADGSLGSVVTELSFGTAFAARIATDGSNYLVTWHHFTNSRADVYGRLLDADAEPVASRITISGAPENQRNAGVAFASGRYLATWVDDRTRDATGYEVLAARLDASGTLLDPDGFRLSSGLGDDTGGEVARMGGEFFVTWTTSNERDPRDACVFVCPGNMPTPNGGGQIVGAPVTAGGSVGSPVPISPSEHATACCGNPRTDPATGDVLVGWVSNFRNYEPVGDRGEHYVRRVSGGMPDPEFTLVNRSATQQDGPAAAGNGTGALTAWVDVIGGQTDRESVVAVRLDAGGSGLDGTGITLSDAGVDVIGRPAVAWGGGVYLVAWLESTEQGTRVRGSRLAPDGTQLDPTPILVAAEPFDARAELDAAWNGSTFLVVYERLDENQQPGSVPKRDRNVHAVRVAPSGVVTDPTSIRVWRAPVSFNEPTLPRVSSDGSDFFVVFRVHCVHQYWQQYPLCGSPWSNDPYRPGKIGGVRVRGDGAVVDPAAVAVGAAPEESDAPDVTFDGVNYFVAWEAERSGSSWDVAGSAVTRGGVVLDPDPILLVSEAGAQSAVALSFNGGHVLAAWTDSRPGGGGPADIYGARLDRAGTIADGGPFAIAATSEGEHAPALAGVAAEDFVAAYARPAPEPPYASPNRAFARSVADEPPPPDGTAPETSITAAPPDPSPSADASFGFTSSERHSTFKCSLDGAAFASCWSPRSYTKLGRGTHTFRVRATDVANNLDATPAVHTWFVDADVTAPVARLVTPGDGTYVNGTLVVRGGQPTVIGPMTVEGRASDAESGIAEFWFEIDGERVSDSLVTYDPEADLYRFTYPADESGAHTIAARARNGSGVVGTQSRLVLFAGQ